MTGMRAKQGGSLLVSLTEDDVKCLAGVIAHLQIAVHETKVIELDVERQDWLNQAEHLVREWGKVFALRRDLATAEVRVNRAT